MCNSQDIIVYKFIIKFQTPSGYVKNRKDFRHTSTSDTINKVTPGRMAQREKIKLCTAFTKPFAGTGFFNKTFPAFGDTGSGYNRATSALMNLAVAGHYPDMYLDYPNVLISRGPLPAAENAAAIANAAGNIFFSWTDNSGARGAKTNDKVLLLAYFDDLKQIIFSFNVAERADCQATLITNTRQGCAAETWISFLSNDEKNTANSVYTGTVQLGSATSL